MAKHNLDSLDPSDFFKILKRREAEIAIADGVSITSENSANLLARKLHPEVQHLTVSDVKTIARGCRLYTLTPDKRHGWERLAPFSAGQYISVTVNIGGHEYSRPYSLCSSPKEAEKGIYEIAVEPVTGGTVSSYIHDNWAVGTEVTVSPPMGNFVYEPLRDAKSVVGIAGGSGITPLLSLAKAVAEGSENCSLTLLYGCRTRDDILFGETLDGLARDCRKIKTVCVLSDERAPGYEYGLIGEKLIREYMPDGEVSFFVCGPAGMYAFVRKELEKAVPSRKYIRLESHYSAPTGTNAKEISVTVRSHGEIKTLRGTTRQTVLEILESGGVAPKSYCRTGECGYCRTRLIFGDFYTDPEREGRRKADIMHGIIHPCCTYPRGNLEIELI